MIIFEKFALTEDEIAFLKQQQAEAVERAVLRERCDQLQMRLQDSQIYGDRAVALVFDTFAQIRKLTGVDEDRTGSVAQILQSILEIWRRLHHEDAFQKGSPEHGFYVSMEDVVAAFALAQHRPDLGQDLLSRVREFKPIYPSVHDVLFACQTLWPRVVEGDDDLVEEISFNLQAFAQKYANSQGKPELADAFTSYLVGAAAVAECRLFDFCQHTDRVASVWERMLRDAERGEE